MRHVHKLEPWAAGGYRAHFRSFDPGDASRSELGFVDAKAVVVAAGTLGSNELLLRCRNGLRTLSQISAALGTRFSGNGDFLLAGTLDANRDIDPGRGPSITAGADFSTRNNHIFIEDLGFPEPFMWLLEGAVPRSSHLLNIGRAVVEYVAQTIGIGSRIGFEAERLFRGGATTRFLPYLGMGTDAADGRIELKNGSIAIQWSHRRSQAVLRNRGRT